MRLTSLVPLPNTENELLLADVETETEGGSPAGWCRLALHGMTSRPGRCRCSLRWHACVAGRTWAC